MPDLDNQADSILRAHGSSDLVAWVRKEIFAPFEPPTPGASFHRHRAAAQRGCALPNPKIHRTKGRAPTADAGYLFPSQGRGGTCSTCGNPSTGIRCRACVTAGSIERELHDYQWKQKRIDSHLARYGLGFEYAMMVLAGAEPDFAPLLIEHIHDREKQIGPAAFWPREETCVH